MNFLRVLWGVDDGSSDSKIISTIKLPVQRNQYFVILHHNMWGYLFNFLLLSEKYKMKSGSGIKWKVHMADMLIWWNCFQAGKLNYLNMVWKRNYKRNLVVWIFLRSLGVICYDRWVLSEGHKNYFKDWCLMNSQSTFLFF